MKDKGILIAGLVLIIAGILFTARTCKGMGPTISLRELRQQQRYDTYFGADVLETNQVVTTKHVGGRFSTRWVIETNDSPRVVDFGLGGMFYGNAMSMTNISSWGHLTLTNGYYIMGDRPCTKEHIDQSQQTVTRYVSSNLVATLVWRNKTNITYLESVPMSNIVHHWHWTKTKAEED